MLARFNHDDLGGRRCPLRVILRLEGRQEPILLTGDAGASQNILEPQGEVSNLIDGDVEEGGVDEVVDVAAERLLRGVAEPGVDLQELRLPCLTPEVEVGLVEVVWGHVIRVRDVVRLGSSARLVRLARPNEVATSLTLAGPTAFGPASAGRDDLAASMRSRTRSRMPRSVSAIPDLSTTNPTVVSPNVQARVSARPGPPSAATARFATRATLTRATPADRSWEGSADARALPG